MSRPTTAACRRHRDTLASLLDDPLGIELQHEARAHLETCAVCRAESAGLVLVGHAVHRTFAGAAHAQPPVDAWPQLRARISRTEARPGHRASSSAGVVIGAALAFVLVLPLGVPAGHKGAVGSVPTVLRDMPSDSPLAHAPTATDGADSVATPAGLTIDQPASHGVQQQSRARIELMRLELDPRAERADRKFRSILVAVE